MYQALVNKDLSFEGVFVAAIKTTGIFCRPTCHAKKPKSMNVEYFSDSKEALSYGYRPCKMCQPMRPVGDKPDWLKALLTDVEKHPELKIKDQNLRERGIDPSRVRRWFKKHHGITFHAYTRAIRINRAFGLIRTNTATSKGNILETALDSGYESLSGFNEAFKKLTGDSPTQSKHHQLITVTRILTPLGPMLAGAINEGVCLLEFTDRRMLETQIARLSKLLNAKFVPGQHKHLNVLDEQLRGYFSGDLKKFTVKLHVPATDFQKQVWSQLQTIPYGTTRSYQQQAEAIHNKNAVRAVAKANGDNRIAIIIPCHRVIGKNGKLTGYGGGLWRKQRLLDLESGQLSF